MFSKAMRGKKAKYKIITNNYFNIYSDYNIHSMAVEWKVFITDQTVI